VFEEIKERKDLLEHLLRVPCQRLLFCKVMDRDSCLQTFGHMPIDVNICVDGHDLNTLIAQRFFNCRQKLGEGHNPQSKSVFRVLRWKKETKVYEAIWWRITSLLILYIGTLSTFHFVSLF